MKKHISFVGLVLTALLLISGCSQKSKPDYDDLTKCIDPSANKVGIEALDGHNGLIAVCNYKTGQLLCCAARVNEKITSDVSNFDNSENPFLYSSYTPGSTMKIVTTICFVENEHNLNSFEYICQGSCQLDDGKVTCICPHGNMSVFNAFKESCNCFYANLSIYLGESKMKETADSLGFNKSLDYYGIKLSPSVFSPVSSKNIDLGWASVGQSTTAVNPAHYLGVISAIANGGTSYLYSSSEKPEKFIQMDSKTSETLTNLMRANVHNTYGDDNLKDLKMCGKTGTAQILGKKNNSLFVGFSKRDDLPLAVFCVVERTDKGFNQAITASNCVMQYFLSAGIN